jgi:Mycobacterium membrane protein
MAKIGVANAARKGWVYLVIVVVILVSGFVVTRLRGIFGVHGNQPITSGSADDVKPFNPKNVVYEVWGSGATANINYLDIHAQPRRIDNVPLPWSLQETTMLPSVSVNVIAQTDGDHIGCRITVNGAVPQAKVNVPENSSDGVNAETFCIVKSA